MGVSGVCAYVLRLQKSQTQSRDRVFRVCHVTTQFREIPGNSGPGRSYSVLRENSDFLEISLRAPCQFQRCCSVLRQNLGSDTKSQKATPCSRLPGNWPRIPREFGEVHSRNYSVLFLNIYMGGGLGVCNVKCNVRKVIRNEKT